MTNNSDYKQVFKVLITTVLKGIVANQYDSVSAKTAIENEYTKLGLDTMLGEYSKWDKFIELIVETSATKYTYADLLNLFNHWADVADELEVELKICVYHGVVNALVRRGMVADDLELSEKLTSFASANDLDAENKYLWDIAIEVLGNV